MFIIIEFTHTFLLYQASVASTTSEGVCRFDNPVTKSAISSWYFMLFIAIVTTLGIFQISKKYVHKTTIHYRSTVSDENSKRIVSDTF